MAPFLTDWFLWMGKINSTAFCSHPDKSCVRSPAPTTHLGWHLSPGVKLGRAACSSSAQLPSNPATDPVQDSSPLCQHPQHSHGLATSLPSSTVPLCVSRASGTCFMQGLPSSTEGPASDKSGHRRQPCAPDLLSSINSPQSPPNYCSSHSTSCSPTQGCDEKGKP